MMSKFMTAAAALAYLASGSAAQAGTTCATGYLTDVAWLAYGDSTSGHNPALRINVVSPAGSATSLYIRMREDTGKAHMAISEQANQLRGALLAQAPVAIYTTDSSCSSGAQLDHNKVGIKMCRDMSGCSVYP